MMPFDLAYSSGSKGTYTSHRPILVLIQYDHILISIIKLMVSRYFNLVSMIYLANFLGSRGIYTSHRLILVLISYKHILISIMLLMVSCYFNPASVNYFMQYLVF